MTINLSAVLPFLCGKGRLSHRRAVNSSPSVCQPSVTQHAVAATDASAQPAPDRHAARWRRRVRSARNCSRMTALSSEGRGGRGCPQAGEDRGESSRGVFPAGLSPLPPASCRSFTISDPPLIRSPSLCSPEPSSYGSSSSPADAEPLPPQPYPARSVWALICVLSSFETVTRLHGASPARQPRRAQSSPPPADQLRKASRCPELSVNSSERCARRRGIRPSSVDVVLSVGGGTFRQHPRNHAALQCGLGSLTSVALLARSRRPTAFHTRVCSTP
ncbi:hypothetical protein AAFF_G00232140 [Aldrovandia affinis]|uniref:Uncharacterized protein n=1 Tax=Aldrovandia affinis TaxID=143900 RepID=A0AAD7RF80_9TELE|nr:hypothetical protein AAFF_G00232140 [Aldrovandia affinis]